MPPSVGGKKEITDYFKLFDYDINLLVNAIKKTGANKRPNGHIDIAFLAAPFVASLILTGIHAYLGVHVVERGVIFVDLSLAQIAALGATIALLLPITAAIRTAPVAYWVSLAFTFMGALMFSTIRSRQRAHSAGSDHRHLLRRGVGGGDSGDEQVDVGERAPQRHAGRATSSRCRGPRLARRPSLYGAIGLFHYIFRHKFLAISMDPKKAEAEGISIQAVGLSLLRFVRLRGDLVGLDCRRAAGVLLPDRAVGGSDAVCGTIGTPARDRLDDGNGGFRAGRLPLAEDRSSDRRHDRLHIRTGADRHGSRAAFVSAEGRVGGP